MPSAVITHGCTKVACGGFSDDKYMLIEPEDLHEFDGMQFIVIDRCKWCWVEFLGGSFAMVDKLTSLRNAASDLEMHKAQNQGEVDPMAESSGLPANKVPKKRKATYDAIDKSVVAVKASCGGIVFRKSIILSLRHRCLDVLLARPGENALLALNCQRDCCGLAEANSLRRLSSKAE